MAIYKARITKQENTHYALIVRIDNDGNEVVQRGYQGRHFKTFANAEKSTTNYINKMKEW